MLKQKNINFNPLDETYVNTFGISVFWMMGKLDIHWHDLMQLSYFKSPVIMCQFLLGLIHIHIWFDMRKISLTCDPYWLPLA